MTRPLHPACALWPWDRDDSFQKLVEDIRLNGLHEPMWLTKDGQMLDGKMREKACEMTGVAPQFRTYEGDDPVGFSISKNARRRHLPRHELAFVVEELATLQHGSNQHRRVDGSKELSSQAMTIREVAQVSGLSEAAIKTARAIKTHGAPNVIAYARSGDLPLAAGAAFARRLPKTEQQTTDLKTIRSLGGNLTRSLKARKQSSAPTLGKEKTVAVSEVTTALRPLVREIKHQTKRHIAAVSLAALSIIASTMERIFEAWESGDTASARRIADSIARDEIRRLKGFYHVSNSEADQQRDPGADPGTRH
jgi:hypothetical protein